MDNHSHVCYVSWSACKPSISTMEFNQMHQRTNRPQIRPSRLPYHAITLVFLTALTCLLAHPMAVHAETWQSR